MDNAHVNPSILGIFAESDELRRYPSQDGSLEICEK